MLTYSELTDICEQKKIFVKNVHSALDMTDTGFRTAIKNQSLPIKKVIPLCNILGISVSYFFGVEQPSGDVIHGSQNKNGKKQIINTGSQETIHLLQQQLEIKDAQIEKLLSIIASK